MMKTRMNCVLCITLIIIIIAGFVQQGTAAPIVVRKRSAKIQAPYFTKAPDSGAFPQGVVYDKPENGVVAFELETFRYGRAIVRKPITADVEVVQSTSTGLGDNPVSLQMFEPMGGPDNARQLVMTVNIDLPPGTAFAVQFNAISGDTATLPLIASSIPIEAGGQYLLFDYDLAVEQGTWVVQVTGNGESAVVTTDMANPAFAGRLGMDRYKEGVAFFRTDPSVQDFRFQLGDENDMVIVISQLVGVHFILNPGKQAGDFWTDNGGPEIDPVRLGIRYPAELNRGNSFITITWRGSSLTVAGDVPGFQ